VAGISSVLDNEPDDDFEAEIKEGMFEVLIYLFENYLHDPSDNGPDRDTLADELHAAGFPPMEINKAFAWLEDLTQLREPGGMRVAHIAKPGNAALRHYTPVEMRRLNAAARGLLLFLEQIGVLDGHTRELVIDRALALETDDIELDDLKWVALMVLFNQPGREQAYAFVEELLYDTVPDHLH
jgi:Smg protein